MMALGPWSSVSLLRRLTTSHLQGTMLPLGSLSPTRAKRDEQSLCPRPRRDRSEKEGIDSILERGPRGPPVTLNYQVFSRTIGDFGCFSLQFFQSTGTDACGGITQHLSFVLSSLWWKCSLRLFFHNPSSPWRDNWGPYYSLCCLFFT